MDINDITTTASELETSTESDFIAEDVTTNNPPVTQMVDPVPELNNDGLDGTYVFYGLGGILIFFVVYMFLYSYGLKCKEAMERQEIELRETYERAAEASFRPIGRRPMSESRIVTRAFNQTGSARLTMSSRTEGSCTETKPKYLDVEKGDIQEDVRILDLPQIPYRNPQEILERNYLPEDNQCPNTTVTEVATTSGVVSQKDENSPLGRVDSWMSEPPLCFSTPQDSNERIFPPEDFKDLLHPNPAVAQEHESPIERKLDEDNVTPTKSGEKQSQPTPEGKSTSSPTSPDVVRRRLTKSDAPQRPFSWQ